jgi:NitT/TauT family transport system substrate-binding protein
MSPSRLAALGLLFVVIMCGQSALALDKLRVGRSGVGIIFTGIEVGDEAKIWESVGLEMVPIQFNGEGRMQQAMTAGEIDVGFGGINGLAYRVKGVPAIAVAAAAGPPYTFVLTVRPDSPIRKADDLKGKRVGVTTAGSETYWLVRELAQQKGWGGEGIQPIPLGAPRARTAALANGEIDGNMTTTAPAFEDEANGRARIVLSFGDMVKEYHAHILFASDTVVAKNPDLVKRFLLGWFKSVAYMKTHRPTGVKIAAKALGIEEQYVAKAYDEEMKGMSDDGAFNPAAIEAIRHSYVEHGLLPTVPETNDLYTDRFVPVKF